MHLVVLLSILILASSLSLIPELVASEPPTTDTTTSKPETSRFLGHYDKGLLRLLRAREFEALESATLQVQKQFENGMLSDIQLRDIYRQFYQLDEQDLAKLKEWKNTVPDSYAAHLIQGVYFKRQGLDARGEQYISRTPADRIEKMRRDHEAALLELGKSLKLTEKPFLSIFHLLDISKWGGSRNNLKRLIDTANTILPNNTLARNRFMTSLAPRWGGSYEEMNRFLAQSKKEGLDTNGLVQLEALIYNDIGMTYLEQQDTQNATKYFFKALELSKRVGGEFRNDWLSYTNNHVCKDLDLQKYC